MTTSIDYYDANAQDFFDSTVDVDMRSIYQEFVSRLAVGATLVDAGCGSGRDARYFAQQGFQVLAFDASEALVTLAQNRTGLRVVKARFLDFQTLLASLDGIWACASLLHVAKAELSATFTHLSQFLKPDAVFYCSFKYGDDEVSRNGRRFTNLDEVSLAALLKQADCGLTISKTWVTTDVRPGREQENWLNAILTKG
ncbi:class I SAM-dependent methyltransferase [Paraferrimonas haliotis]|uniref:Tellurite resistance n=1 Tax=Paraferrimonas haliotis TaxID=2013866 RepID=A0AA37TLW5_9GAMM|nr:class I SAM-dependent methyltransferase [Paraferrimonas haliotis]GLS83699.1 tellurite resistance [Paraferrimonas haliotis]